MSHPGARGFLAFVIDPVILCLDLSVMWLYLAVRAYVELGKHFWIQLAAWGMIACFVFYPMLHPAAQDTVPERLTGVEIKVRQAEIRQDATDVAIRAMNQDMNAKLDRMSSDIATLKEGNKEANEFIGGFFWALRWMLIVIASAMGSLVWTRLRAMLFPVVKAKG